MGSGKYWNSFMPIFLSRIEEAMKDHMSELVSEYGLTHAHCTYLIALNLLDGPTSSQLSIFLDMDQGNTFRVIRTLTEKGFVTSDRQFEGQRNYRLYLTESGKKLAEYVMEDTSNFMDNSMSNIPDEDLLIMRRTLLTILEGIDPNLERYVDNKYTNPYYTYLNVIITDDEGKNIATKPRRLINSAEESSTIPMIASTTPVLPNPEHIVKNPAQLHIVIKTFGDGIIYDIFDDDNGKLIHTSAVFESLEDCVDNITEFKKISGCAIRDLTLKRPQLVLGDAYEILNEGGRFYFRMITEKGEVILISRTYSSKTYCKQAIEKLRIGGPFAKVHELY